MLWYQEQKDICREMNDYSTSMMVWPRKSSDSRVNFWRSFDLISLSSSQTRTLIRSDELWHSLNHFIVSINEKYELWPHFWLYYFSDQLCVIHIRIKALIIFFIEWINNSQFFFSFRNWILCITNYTKNDIKTMISHQNLQIKAFIPDGVQFLRHSPSTLFDLSNLTCHVWIRRAAFIFGD